MDDVELVRGLRERQEGAVELFLDRYRSLLQHCISQFETDPTSRDDLFQDLTWYVFERLDRNTFDSEKGTFGTWLYRVSWCRCVDLKRKQNARRALRLTLGSDDLEEHVDSSPGPVEFLGDAEVGTLVRQALEELPDEAKKLLRLRYLDGLTLAEIGRSLSISMEQTKYRLRRALADIRVVLLTRFPEREAVE